MTTPPSPGGRSRPHTRWIRGVAALTAAATMAACGGGDDSGEDGAGDATVATAEDSSDDSTATTRPTPSETTPPETTPPATTATSESTAVSNDASDAADSAVDGDDFSPGAESFRVVNLSVDPVDVYVRTTGLVQGYEIQPNLAPGDVTEFFAPPQDGSVIVTTAGAGDPTCVTGCDHFISNTSAWDDTGDTFTILVHDADGAPAAFDLWEETGANTTSANAMVAADPSSGQFVAIAIDVAEDDFGMRVGLSQTDGCMEPINLTGGILVGGNQTPAFVYDGDSAEVFLYDNQDRTCTGEPVGGPFTVSGGPGSRTLLFLSGTPEDLDALIVPFGSDDGPDAPGDLDEAVELLTDELTNVVGIPPEDAGCVAEVVVRELEDLIVFEDGQMVDMGDTPENNQRMLEALSLASGECGVDTSG